MKETKFCVNGLGYCGLSLSHLFSNGYQAIGFDMKQTQWLAELSGDYQFIQDIRDSFGSLSRPYKMAWRQYCR